MSIGEDLRNFFHMNFNARRTLLRSHQNRQLKHYQNFFETVESKPLTELQRRAVILDERRNLVVVAAAAGP